MIASLEKTDITTIPAITDLFLPTMTLFNNQFYLLTIKYSNGNIEKKIFNNILEREKEYNKLKRGMK